MFGYALKNPKMPFIHMKGTAQNGEFLSFFFACMQNVDFSTPNGFSD